MKRNNTSAHSPRITLLGVLMLSAFGVYGQVELITGTEERDEFEGKSYLVVKSLTLKPGFEVSGQNGAWYAKAHSDAVPPTAPSPDQNFIREEVILTQGVATEAQVRALSSTGKTTAFSYRDGVGRFLQSAAMGASPALKDVVHPAMYDALGRPSRAYLPYVANTATGAYRTGAFSEQAAFYDNTSDKVSDDTRPYSEITFDNSPLNRVTQSTAVGAAWASEPVNNNFKINDAAVVRLWTLSNNLPVSTTTWPAGTLAIREMQDEEGFIARTYADFLGREILSEAQAQGGQWARTYTIYNEYENPLFIIPPAASGNLNPDQAFADKWYFQYEYDEYQRVIGSKAPGAAWIYTIYDKWDRPVLTQDGNQRAKDPAEWSFVKYDDLNRPIATGIYRTNNTRSSLTGTLAAFSGRYEIRNSTAVAYSLNQTFPNTITEADLFTITCYDDYGYLSNAGWDAQNKPFDFTAETGYGGTAFTTVKDLITGSKVRIIGSNVWLNTVTYYDNRYRPIQTISENPFEKLDRLTRAYDFTGQVIKTKQVHSKPDNGTVYVHELYTYDHLGRPLNTWRDTGTQAQEPGSPGAYDAIISSLGYNDLGQVVKKRLHSADNGTTWLQSLDYRYDIQGRLTNINYTDPETGDAVDYFSQELAYNTSQGTGNVARLDGLVTGSRWKHDGGPEQAYRYTYDAGKRLATAVYRENTGAGWTSGQNLYNESAEYDLNGNITDLSRNADDDLVAVNIDALDYAYDGNRLTGVTDNAPVAYRDRGFNDGNTSGNDYLYDDNGNLTLDGNKDISVTYNAIDLPERVTFSDNSYLQYVYSADGTRLSQALYNSADQLQTKTEYAGDKIYVNGVLSLVYHSEGRFVTPEGDADAGIYQYNLTDHLGSVRVVLSTQTGQGSMMMATMEDAGVPQEEEQFINYDRTRRVTGRLFDHTRTSTEGKSLRLNGTARERAGLATSLSVMPGDTVSLEVFVKYMEKENGFNAKGLVDNIATAVTGGAAGTAADGGPVAMNENTLQLPFGAALDKAADSDSGVPRAYLNWIFFDRHFVMKNGGYKRISGAAKEDGTDSPHERLADEIVIAEPGYVYVFISNEDDQPSDVYFDDFSVTITEGPVIQVNGYYPYGLTAYSYIRENEQFTSHLFQGKQYDSLTQWHDFHARQYDAALGRWFVVDPQGQFVSPYLAMGNNPVMYVDPDGEFVFTALALIAAPFTGGASLALLPYTIGADVGMWQGGTMANGTANPFKWDYSSGKTWGYMGAGALVGAASGGAANAVATSGMVGANTAAIMTGSFINSVGTHIYTGGQTDVSISFGVGSFNMSTGQVRGLWNWGDLSTGEKIGYGLGALANVQDAFAGINGAVANVKARKEIAGHSWIEGDGINISVGPAVDNKPHLDGVKWESQYLFKTVKGRNFITRYDPNETFSTTLNNVNVSKLQRMTNNLNKGLSLSGKHSLNYGVWNGCVNQTSRALFRAGVFNVNAFLPITAPVLLNAELALRNYGMMFSYYMTSYR